MKKILTLTFLTFIFLITIPITHAQMMSSSGSTINRQTIQQQAEEQIGKKLLNQLQNKTTTCQKLTNDNFEKIGEYFMGQAVGDTSRHIVMNNMMKSMMGKQGEEQMHIAWGKRGTSCSTSAQFAPTTQEGGGVPMMGYSGMMNGFGGMLGFGLLGLLTWVLVITILVLLVVYLWKQIKKK